jgi:Amt family ammonium transporter
LGLAVRVWQNQAFFIKVTALMSVKAIKTSLGFTAFLLPTLMSAPAMADTISGADTAWMLTSTALVLFMTLPGLSLFYAGLVRVKNALSVLMQCFALTALMSVLWFVIGYTLAFGSSGVEQGPWIGDLGNLFWPR